ncbi:hypothetical protein [Anaerococcus porci]|uniref:hypothetical protein n=1 Tax=Anaerococcus porci TaxID=2652269 RepID=UPI002A755070|nr:hypothetical protein [Anaerococcus porci]MDY3006017.1 hypothetical protein [Anaerococcus porci]
MKEEKKKMGRPTDNPKVDSLNVRLDREASDILRKYAKKYNITRTESARIGIKKLKEDL